MEANCSLGFKCKDDIKGCDISRQCSILQKIMKISRSRYNYYNYGRSKNHDHRKDGRLKTIDVRMLYLSALQEGFKCPHCGVKMELDDGRQATSHSIDHIVPRSAGGKNNLENLIICCHDCNNEKAKKENPQQKKRTEVN